MILPNGANNNDSSMIKKGYVFIILVAVFISVSGTFRHWHFERKESVVNFHAILYHSLMLFFIVLLPGVFLVRWYYRMKLKVVLEKEALITEAKEATNAFNQRCLDRKSLRLALIRETHK